MTDHDRIVQCMAARAEQTAALEAVFTARWDRAKDVGVRGFQDRWEFFQAFQAAADLQPSRVLELGSYRGLWLYMMAAVAKPGAVFAAVDMDAVTRGGRENAQNCLRDEGYSLELVDGDTHDPSVVDRVKAIMPEVDLLHIDADHTFDAVRDDWRLYSPLVRPGGVIMFHDTRRIEGPACQAVNKYWNNLLMNPPAGVARSAEWTTAHTDKSRGMGIGCLWLKD